MKRFIQFVAALLCLAAPAAAQDTVTYNANPTVAFTYGSGNDYLPANAAVLDTAGGVSELALRAHVPFQVAAPSNGAGVYTFALGSDVSFDYSFVNFLTGQISLQNLLTGQSYTSPLIPLAGATLQDSQRLSFGFLSSLGFNPNIDNTYQINLTGTDVTGSHTLTAYAQLGAGAAIAAVPEPATWAMMLMGFGAVGFSMRRRRRNDLLQLA